MLNILHLTIIVVLVFILYSYFYYNLEILRSK